MSFMKFKSLVLAIVALTLVMSSAAFAYAPKDQPDKKGILVVSFGTSMPEAKKAIDNLVNATKIEFPGTEVRVAYTSNIIRRKIAKEQNVMIPTPAEAIARMNDEGFTHLYVTPMHIIPGEEYDDIRNLAEAVATIRGKYGFKVVKVSKPYLASVSDCEVMADILANRFKDKLDEEGTAIVLMGHGTPHHIANAMYSQLQLALNKKVPGRFFLGTVEAAPQIDDVIANLKKDAGIKKLVLSPLMIVAGDHANNDLAGEDDPESWISLLKAEGYDNIETYLVGLGEDSEMAKVFTAKIAELMK